MLGDAGKRIQRMVDIAEDLYEKVNQLRQQINELRETVEDTSERVSAIEAEQAEQRAILDAIADENGLDAERIVKRETDDGEETTTTDGEKAPANGG